MDYSHDVNFRENGIRTIERNAVISKKNCKDIGLE